MTCVRAVQESSDAREESSTEWESDDEEEGSGRAAAAAAAAWEHVAEPSPPGLHLATVSTSPKRSITHFLNEELYKFDIRLFSRELLCN